MASTVPQYALVAAMTGALDLDTDALKVMLLKSTYVPNPDHKFAASLTASECDATNYAGGFGGAGRKTLASKTVTEDTANNRARFDAADPATWTALGGASNNTLGFAAVIKENASDDDSLVVAVLEFASTFNTNGGDFSVQFDALGIFYTQH
jgi:hypothetical protein